MSDRVRLIHWNELEAAACAARLVAAGYAVDARPFDQAALKAQRADPPAAFVIDLSRLPSHGREVAAALRGFAATRRVPLVFADGAPEKVERVRRLLPDASFTPWSRIRSTLKRAMARPVAAPVVPSSSMAAYAGTPLPAKLGISAGSVVALVDAPDGFETTLGDLPVGVTLTRRPQGGRDTTLWFVRSQRALDGRLAAMTRHGKGGGLWILWPKKTSGLRCDLTQASVRRAGLAAGLVDFKICAVDATWSGLRFSVRGRRRA